MNFLPDQCTCHFLEEKILREKKNTIVKLILSRNCFRLSISKYLESKNKPPILAFFWVRYPFHFSVKFSVKNWERIKKGQANKLLISAYNESETLNLPWTNGIKRLLNSVGMSTFYTSLYPNKLPFIFKKIAGRMSDIFNQNSFEIIKVPSNKLRIMPFSKRTPVLRII